MQNQYLGRLGIAFFFAILLAFNGNIFSINLDDNRENPFRDINDFESVVYIKIGNTVCSGVLINHRTVLTAAHCLIEDQKATISSANHVKDSEILLDTTSFLKIPENPRYSFFTGASYDMALISLQDPLLNVEPLKLNKKLPSVNSEVYISGYGLHGTGSIPDQDFDGKKRWGKNILSLIALESAINGAPISNTPDKIILSFYFDQNFDKSESMISLGDSGSPLILKENGEFSIIGIASWIKKDPQRQNRGYGSSAGYSSVYENLDWLIDNDSLKNSASISDGSWTDPTNWASSFYPDNFVPSLENYNSLSARYYSVEVKNKIELKKQIIIDSLVLQNNAHLALNGDASLEVLLDSVVNDAIFENKGTFQTNNLSINEGSYINIKNTFIENELKVTRGSLKNNSSISAKAINIYDGDVSGSGIFNSEIFLNRGVIYPGKEPNSIGKLTFKSFLKNEGIIQVDISNGEGNDEVFADKFLIGGNLQVNPVSKFFSGNTFYELITFNESEGENFSEVSFLKKNFGRLNKNIIYKENSIDLSLLNPSYEILGLDKRSKEIGIYLDSFSDSTSLRFQNLLDQINYITDDQKVSDRLNNVVLLSHYSHFIERIDMTRESFPEGLFIGESKFEKNKKGVNYKSDLRTFNVHYENFNLAYSVIDSTLNKQNSRELTDSKAYKLDYKIPLNWFDLYFGFYKEKIESKNGRILKFNNFSDFVGNHRRDIEFDRFFFGIEKSLNMWGGNLKAGLSQQSTNIKTDAFDEELNDIINSYLVSDLNIDSFKPYFGYSREYTFGNNKIIFGAELNKSFYNKEDLKTRVVIDNAKENLLLIESMDISEDVNHSLYISNTFNDSLFFKLSFNKSNEHKMTILKIGYLF